MTIFSIFLNRKAALPALLIALATPFATAQQDHRKWMNYGGGTDSSQYVILNQINKSNVNQLKIVWIYPTGDDVKIAG